MKTVLRLLRMVSKYWRGVGLAVAFGWATVVSWVALITTSAYLISAAALQPSVAELQVAIVGVRFFGISRGIFRYLERYVSHTVTFKLLAELRVSFYQAVEPLAPAGLWEYQSGDLLGRIVDDVETLQDFYVRVVAPPVVALLSSGAVLIFFGRWGWELSLTLLGFQLFCGVAVPLLTRALTLRPGRQVISHRAALRATIGDSLGGLDEVVANNLEDKFKRRFNQRSAGLGSAQKGLFWIEGLHSALIILGVNLGMLAVLVLAIPMVASGMLDGRLLAVLTLGAVASFEAILPLPLAFQNLVSSLKSGGRLFEIMDKTPHIPPGGENLPVDIKKRTLGIKNLSFAYSQNTDLVLDNIDLDLTPGKRIAVVGASGAGKSTLLKLLQRYWEFQQGEILLDGVDIRQLDGDQVRSCFSMIAQDTFLFNAPIVQNIQLAKRSASGEEISSAIERAQLFEFINQLPEGQDTWVGEYGVKVSGGQRQRIAIARALLKDAPILLLDEPTANLDPYTERQVINAILDTSDRKAILLVTHRLVGMEAMDEIIVLENGRIVERGSHQELLSLIGKYAKMWKDGRDYLRDRG
jgi:ATP-binding cassette subfamily C protein CydC